MKKILLIEDEQNVAAFIQKGLKEEHYDVAYAANGKAGLALLEQEKVALIILDIILPDINGFEICKKIRKKGFTDVPILMLTALGTTENVVKGLDSGADDYLPKPFKFTELLARIRALLRRKNLAEAVSQNMLSISDLTLDLNSKITKRAGVEIQLTLTEFRLLKYFMSNQNKVLSRIDLLDEVWGINFEMGTNVVDVYVNYLRNKIDKHFEPKLIHTVIGMGYIMKINQSSAADENQK